MAERTAGAAGHPGGAGLRAVTLERQLRAARRRLVARVFCEAAARCALAAGGALVGLAAVQLFRDEPWPVGWLFAVPSVAFVLSVLWVWSRVPTLAATAAHLDRAEGTRDRFTTALALCGEKSGGLREAALGECGRFIESFDARAATPFCWPRAARWLAVPLVVLGLLAWHQQLRDVAARPDPSAVAAARDQAAALEEMAREVAQAAKEQQSPELEKAAAAMLAAAERIAADRSRDPKKNALAEMSALESTLAGLAPDEADAMKALAAAMARQPATQPAGAALQKGEPTAAAEALEKLAENLREPNAAEQLAEAMREALAALPERRAAAARQMQAAAQPGEGQAEALRKLAQMMRGGSPGKAGDERKPVDEKTLQQILTALENLKHGQPGAPAPGKGEQKGVAQFPIRTPGGKGGDDDQGTSANPFGEQQPPPVEASAPLRIEGALGEGEVLSAAIPAGPDAARATQPYRELYEAMAPAAEQAVLREEIPLGSRLYIRRYFESIRPEE